VTEKLVAALWAATSVPVALPDAGTGGTGQKEFGIGGREAQASTQISHEK
jgi:hypothetical protein